MKYVLPYAFAPAVRHLELQQAKESLNRLAELLQIWSPLMD